MKFDAKALLEAAFLGNPQEVFDLYTQNESFDVVIEKDDETYAGRYEGNYAWIGTSGSDYFDLSRSESEFFVGNDGNDFFTLVVAMIFILEGLVTTVLHRVWL